MKFKPAVSLVLVFATVTFTGCGWVDAMKESGRLRAMSDSTPEDTTVTDVVASVDVTGRQASLLSAFFGLDDALPRFASRVFCSGAAGKDGMPVVFSHEIDVETLQAGDFRVVAESGTVGEITCVTPAPADDIGESRTVLMIGQFGSADDQPASVEIIGNLLSIDGQLNFRGMTTDVIPLEAGPTMEWSEAVPESQWNLGHPGTAFPGGGGDSCPEGTAMVIRVTWAGGVTKPGGDEIDDLERQAYRVTLSAGDEGEMEVVPYAVGDLGDGDNNHELCLDRAGVPLRVDFPVGLLTDPREDPNPVTRIEVTGSR